jgi:hypothetical protein
MRTLVFLALFAGCGSSVGSNGHTVGNACTIGSDNRTRDCDSGSICLLNNPHFAPFNMCTVVCETASDCPSGSTCVEELPVGTHHACAVLCSRDADCAGFGHLFRCSTIHVNPSMSTAGICWIP